jgi:hypothetical protein
MAIEKRSILGNEKVVGRQFFLYVYGGGQFSYPGYQKNETGIFCSKFPWFLKTFATF